VSWHDWHVCSLASGDAQLASLPVSQLAREAKEGRFLLLLANSPGRRAVRVGAHVCVWRPPKRTPSSAQHAIEKCPASMLAVIAHVLGERRAPGYGHSPISISAGSAPGDGLGGVLIDALYPNGQASLSAGPHVGADGRGDLGSSPASRHHDVDERPTESEG